MCTHVPVQCFLHLHVGLHVVLLLCWNALGCMEWFYVAVQNMWVSGSCQKERQASHA
jgi:hypothetical protein